jgi:cytochrome c oxidase subunit II
MNATSRSLGLGWMVALALALSAAPSSAQDLERGAELFQLCAQCHGANGGGNQAYLAPAIAGLPEWYVQAQLHKFQSGGRGTHFDDVGGMRMRPMSMWLHGDADVANVAAYVASLPKTWPKPQLEGGDPEAGKAKYAVCIACHGVNGEGNQALNAPPLVGASDWYMLTSLKNFKAGVRGTNPKDTTGALMRPMSMTLADDQAILDVIAYISTLNPSH